mgnify:CR=1 FL=1
MNNVAISRHYITVLSTSNSSDYCMLKSCICYTILFLYTFMQISVSYLFSFYSLECPVGYRGSDCIFKCEPPTYGPNCIKTCHCTKDQCDYQFGCKLSSDSGIITLPYVYDSRTNVKYVIYSILFYTTLADCMNPFR